MKKAITSRTSGTAEGKNDTYFLDLWPFLISVYRALGKSENALTPADAVWLGLIDTVR